MSDISGIFQNFTTIYVIDQFFFDSYFSKCTLLVNTSLLSTRCYLIIFVHVNNHQMPVNKVNSDFGEHVLINNIKLIVRPKTHFFHKL